jgi:GH15 family glucan-1,4-alpha-glucosidase
VTATHATAPGPDGRLAAVSLEVILAGQSESGAFVASPTFGQYRYAWFRDGAFIAEGLDIAGRLDASGRFHDWVAGVIVGARDGIERSIAAGQAGHSPPPGDYLHCRYELDGTPGPDDWPTFQLDGPGIWLWSLAHHAEAGGVLRQEHHEAAALAARYISALWNHPSYDAWEESPAHVHTSTRAALLAGLRAVPRLLRESADPSIGIARERVEELLLGAGGPLTKWHGTDAVDGSLLWIVAPYDLLDPHDPTFATTLARIEAELVSVDGGVHRYATDTFYGGGEWLLLTAALGRVYIRRNGSGDRDRAARCLRWIEAQASRDGWLPEQVATQALHPDRIDEWRKAWGESACPLLWSHATYLALLHELG